MTPDYRVLITGCRDWTDRDAVFRFLDSVRRHIGGKQRLVVVHGAARGADSFASQWFKKAKKAWQDLVAEESHPADWNKHGKRAGPIRNRDMADLGANLCGAFWDGTVRRRDGSGSGTHDMIVKCVARGIPVRIVPKARRNG